MPTAQEFLLGEFQRTVDERYRLSVPSELGDALTAESTDCILAKERPGCLSLWSATLWQTRLDEGVELVKQKMRAGKLQERIAEVQLFGRLLSTRHRPVQLAGRGRLVIPEGFREFLGVEPGGEVQIVGRGRVHRDLAARRLVEVSRRAHAEVPSPLRSAVARSAAEHNSRANVSMPGPAESPGIGISVSPRWELQVTTDGFFGRMKRPPILSADRAWNVNTSSSPHCSRQRGRG